METNLPKKTHHLDKHEAICAERYAHIMKRMDRIEHILFGSIAFCIATITAIAVG